MKLSPDGETPLGVDVTVGCGSACIESLLMLLLLSVIDFSMSFCRKKIDMYVEEMLYCTSRLRVI